MPENTQNRNLDTYRQLLKPAYQKLEKNLTPARIKKLTALQSSLEIEFNFLPFLEKALIHRSYYQNLPVGKDPSKLLYNQRVEFLGDSIINAVISEYLFCSYPYLDEGGLSKLKSIFVSKKTLSALAMKYDFASCIRLGKGEEKGMARKSEALLCDVFEAVCGAYYLDSGYQQCRKFINRIFAPAIKDILQTGRNFNYKSILQEWLQKKGFSIPKYAIEQTNGPSHKREFVVLVWADELKLAEGFGSSKKEAEIQAACQAIEIHYKEALLKDKNLLYKT